MTHRDPDAGICSNRWRQGIVGAGCKWTLGQLRAWMRGEGIADGVLWQEICSVFLAWAWFLDSDLYKNRLGGSSALRPAVCRGPEMCPPIGIRLVRVFTGAQLRRCGHMLSRFVLDGLQVCVLTLLAAVPDIQANDAKVLDYTATSIFFLHFRPFLQPCHPHAPWGNKKKKSARLSAHTHRVPTDES